MTRDWHAWLRRLAPALLVGGALYVVLGVERDRARDHEILLRWPAAQSFDAVTLSWTRVGASEATGGLRVAVAPGTRSLRARVRAPSGSYDLLIEPNAAAGGAAVTPLARRVSLEGGEIVVEFPP